MHSEKAGSMRLSVALSRKGSRLLTQIASSTTAPKPDPEAGLFYVRDGQLTKDDPFQQTIQQAIAEQAADADV